jgi:beta-glucanase (GH16 family)
LTPSFAPDGAPILALPAGFAPIINYTNPVKDYEFDGSSLPAGWAASANSAHGMETMYQPSQVTMTGSSVALTAINQPSGGYPTTSGWISTEGNYTLTHGLIDFKAKMPAGQGLWSGLWLDQPDASNPWGEIDVQEMLLNNTHTVYGSLHSWAPSDWGETQSTVIAADASAGYNDYQLAWQPGLMTWAVNGIAYAQYTQAQAIAAGYPWVFDDNSGFYLIASLAVGTANEWPGAPNTTTTFPASMQIQSIKVWQ